MNPDPSHAVRATARMSDAVFALTLALLLLAPLAIAGVALINTGLGRSRSAAQALLGNLAIIAVAVIVFALVGATLRRHAAGTSAGGIHLPRGRQALELARRRLVSAPRPWARRAAGAACAAL